MMTPAPASPNADRRVTGDYQTWGSADGARRQADGSHAPQNTSGEEQPYNPLTAGLPSTRRSGSGLLSEQYQQQIPSAAAVVSLQQAADSPRSPSRLRYSYKSSTSPRHMIAASMPEFIHVEEVPASVASEDVQIQHVRVDEHKQQADVQNKIISQVDELVEYFNALYHDDQMDINLLQQELAAKNVEVSTQKEIIQRLHAARPEVADQQAVYYVDLGLRAAVRRAWRPRHTCCCVLLLLLLIAVMLAIVLPVKLVQKHVPLPPSFTTHPQVLSATSSSIDVTLGVSEPTVVRYVLLPRAAGRRLQQTADSWKQYSSDAIAAAAAGWGSTALEGVSSGCGSLYISNSNSNVTFSISSQQNTECVSQRTAAASGGPRVSCERCPLLQPSSVYELLLLAGWDGRLSDPVHVEVKTAALLSSSAPTISSSPDALTGSTVSSRSAAVQPATAEAASENSFRISFTVDTPGVVSFFVVYDRMYAPFGDRYLVFDNAVSDALTQRDFTRIRFTEGVVAQGNIQAGSPNIRYSCTIGGSNSSTCSCSHDATCTQEAECFGGLCDYSTTALMPNTSYKVVLLPVSQDGTSHGTLIKLGPFTTLPATRPPFPSSAMGITPVGPERFTIQKIQQDKPGYVHVVVTQPFNQASQLTAGTATSFTAVSNPATRHRRLASTEEVYHLPDKPGADDAGTLFFPPCKEVLTCNASTIVTSLVNPLAEKLVFQQCIPLNTITKATSMVATGLSNATLYRVLTIHSDTNRNEAVWSAMVCTQDLTPPVLTVVETPPPDFDRFTVRVRLNEPGTIYGGLLLSADQAQVSATAACEPLFAGPLVTRMNPVTVSDSSQVVTLTFDQGLTANTDYLLRLIAKDNFGNCQSQFTDIPIHTLDNIPPVTLAMDVTRVTGDSAALQSTLNEPGTVYYMVLHNRAGAAICPTIDQLFALTLPAGAPLPSPSSMGNFLVVAADTPTFQNISGLTSETSYRACAVAHDNTRLQNRQTAVGVKDFKTLDITPPQLTAWAVPSSDGNFTCSRANYLCSLVFSTHLSEPGGVVWALVANDSLPATLPTPQQLFNSIDNVKAVLPGAVAAGNLAAVDANSSAAQLASDTVYVLLLAARDAATAADGTATPNYMPRLSQLTLTAPDVTPPEFSNVSLASVADTELTLSVTLTEASNVYFVVVPHPSVFPTTTEVAAGKAINGTAPVTAGESSAAASTFTIIQATGLTAGQFYDVYLVAKDDPAGNLQLRVTNLTRIRTTDSTPPIITDLTASFKPPMTFSITATATKPGWLIYAPRKAADPAPTAAEILSAFQTRDPSLANFTATLDIPTAGVAAAGGECVVDGDQLVVYAVAQDGEGQWPDRQNNTSPVASAKVQLIQPNFGASCIPPVFLAPLRPSLTVHKAAPLSGILLGTRNSSTSPTGTSWQQYAAAMMGSDVQLTGRAGAVKLPGAINLRIAPNPPAAISVLVQNSVLVPDANSADGSTMRMSYQLKDTAGRTQVDTTGLVIQPVLGYTGSTTPPAGVPATGNMLPECDVALLGQSSGIGQCSVAVPRRFFPSSGTLSAGFVFRVMQGSTQLTASSAAPIQLQAPPSPPPFAPSTPGLLITLPNRPVYMGEVIKVTLEAVNTQAQGLTGFSVPLKYNMQQLRFISAQLSGLWLAPTQRPVPVADVGAFYVVDLQCNGRSGSSPDAAYRLSSSMPLVEVYFRIVSNVPSAATPAISISSAPGRNFVLDPSWANPYHQINSFNGQGSTGTLNIAAITTLGVWAWADAYDIFNTAALSGEKITTTLHGVAVRSYGTMDGVTGDSVTGCVITDGMGAADVIVNQAVCKVTVDAVNTIPAKNMVVTLLLADGSPGSTAQIMMNIWYPVSLVLSAADTTLNKVLPINAAEPSSSCLDLYQSTPLTATADWSNGGNAADDAWLAVDVTDLLTYRSSDTAVAMVQTGALVKGVREGKAIITATPAVGASALAPAVLSITVSNDAVCLQQLSALATTGAGLSATAPGASPIRPNVKTAISWEAQQQLIWEDSNAVVLSYARFSDGAVMDVTGRATVTAAVPAVAGPSTLPFSLSVDNSTYLSMLRMNATVGFNNTCQQYLATSWSVCNLPLGTGSGTVRIQLPDPAAINNLTATPVTITSPANAASLPPASLPTSSSLLLLVGFSDGTVRDFSSDSRTAYTVTAGSGLCNVLKGSEGGYQVVATGSTPGVCEITATVTFPNRVPLTASTQVEIVTMTGLQVAALGVNTLVLPDPLANNQLLQDDSLLLLKCDARNYDTRTLWSFAVLSNCTSNRTCPMLGSINDARYLALSSSNTSVAAIMTGFPGQPDYPTYGLLGNRLVPFTAGSTTTVITFGSNSTGVTALSRNIAVSVKDTYQPGWPTAAAVSDTSVSIAANMSDEFIVSYQMVEGSKLDLLGSPPSPGGVETAGVTLVSTTAQGQYHLSATAEQLKSGTNYTMLTTVRQGSVLAPGVTALTGILVPDTTAPSFTRTALKGSAVPDAATGDWSFQLDLGLNEQGRVYFAVYGSPSCITADPTYDEVRTGANLADPIVNKCNCSSNYCAAAAKGDVVFAGASTDDVVTIAAKKPPFPFDDLPAVATCITYAATTYASKEHAVYFVAEDDLPTYKGWSSSCKMPIVSQTTPPTPCQPVTIGRCNNTPPAVEKINRQEPPFVSVDVYSADSAKTAPASSPLKGKVSVVDTVPAGFHQASLNSTGSSLIFTFQTRKIGLVMWRLVEQVTVEIANGYVAVKDASVSYSVKMDRKCSGVPLVPGTAYALWYNMTDIYGSTTDISILKINM